MSTTAPDTQKPPEPPPNLRVAEDETKECDVCAHYSRGRCQLYQNLPVDGEWTCDSFKKGTQSDEPDENEPAPFKGKNLQQAEKEAMIRVRAHQRRRRIEQSAPGA